MKIQNGYSSIGQMMESMDASKIRISSSKQSTTQSVFDPCSFQQVLEQTKDESAAASEGVLKFSKHANQRLESRNIDLTQNQLERLENGTQKAREKGINESLVMVDNLAFIVNVKNNTVVTAVNNAEDSIFTNIDGAVIS